MIPKIIEYILLTAIPAITTYCASSGFFDFLIETEILSEAFDVKEAQEICQIVSIVFSIVIMGPLLIYQEYRNQVSQQRTTGLYNVIKQIITSTFASLEKNDSFQFNMRIFVPNKNIKYKIAHLFNKNCILEFKIKNIVPFAKKDITEHLSFRVSPESQGLVGQCYQKKAIVYDECLLNNNSTEYNLDETQINRTSDLKWSICVPILDENNQVVSIIAFDSCISKLRIEAHKDEIRQIVNTVAILLYDCVPILFK